MKWISHQTVTGVLAYAVTSDLLFTAGAIFGSVIPDKVEGRPQKIGYAKWRKRHRGLSHWAILYLLIFFALIQFFNIENVQTAISNKSHPLRLIFSILFGIICHIAEDALCGKVPTITPNIKRGVRLFKVGSLQEYIVVILLILGIYVIKII